MYDNGSEFKLHFKTLCDTYRLKHKQATIKNPQVNLVMERLHVVLVNILCTSQMDGNEVTSDTTDTFITDVAYTVRSTHHTVLGSIPTVAIFVRELLFNIPHVAD